MQILSFLGGLTFFLFGMSVMERGLGELGGGRLQKILARIDGKPLRGVILGVGATTVVQSSSATTVSVVGLVDAELMSLSTAFPVIIGANIGTSATAWILGAVGLELNILKLFPIVGLVGTAIIILLKNKTELGYTLSGFALILAGMDDMSAAALPLAGSEILLTAGDSPFLGLLSGTLLTAIIQSSSASVGILQVLCASGQVALKGAIPIILGQNIGTCVTALISCAGRSKNAKKTALMHLGFNLGGGALWLLLYFIFGRFIPDIPISPVGIAAIHTVFNLSTGTVFLLFT